MKRPTTYQYHQHHRCEYAARTIRKWDFHKRQLYELGNSCGSRITMQDRASARICARFDKGVYVLALSRTRRDVGCVDRHLTAETEGWFDFAAARRLRTLQEDGKYLSGLGTRSRHLVVHFCR